MNDERFSAAANSWRALKAALTIVLE